MSTNSSQHAIDQSSEDISKQMSGPFKKKYSHSWTLEEDRLLEEAVSIYGPKHWQSIADRIPSRTRKQCRERWCNHLDPKIDKTSWKPHEDAILFRLHKKVGNQWSYIRKHLPGRTANDIKNRFTCKTKKICSMSAFTAVSPALFTVL
ncbi:transcription factor MYB23, putative [Entamoeba invadens IP1]|uniref:Transcription factor MYB23, putative n=1 Tax=Entamoeba invadens IP1 TaxID=370355 RepID=A0A0A1TWF9_ENTIV|nr:transcription factor MYB23, putative [Entamoeba invadens IP1]ELP84981.1 transcription factor MYB23, putative [Entamoeba invadens IP1]|eukprot:XP_004184327.1 transcription factor MYB23, putative [Entamoeba invadens IP1]